jgi:exoribonuclease-2
VTLGIHIAAPGLAIAPGSALDQVARARLSTVYMPGHKITMLPDAVVQAYTLDAGRDCPAVSLYVTIDEATLAFTATETRLERVPIAHNLRHDKLDELITADWLAGAPGEGTPAELLDLHPQLAFLWRLAQHLKAQREIVRGKPESFNRPDYSFKLEGVAGDEPEGEETVQIGTRKRGAPLDLMVAEAMIVANSSWGQWLADNNVPGIYRSQHSLAPGVKVRMGTKAQPHAGIGVKCYAWSTSPLRRYTDLVNQWQIIACARHGQTAALAAPFKPKDAELFSVISAFDAAYSAYNQFQGGMERYWTLKHLQQSATGELTATVMKDGLVRADTLPLVLRALGAEGLPRGAHVRVRLGQMDLISLDVGGTVVERLDQALDAATEDEGEGEEELAAPLAIAVEMDGDEPAPPPTDNPGP